MKFPKRVALLLCFVPFGVYSLQTINLDEHDRVSAFVAMNELNRIQVKNDRISQVFGKQGEFGLEMDEHTGQVFIQPAEQSKPLNLSILTEKGLSIDLLLMPKRVPAETIILKSPQSDVNITQPGEKGRAFEESLKALVVAMYQGKPLRGYAIAYAPQIWEIWKDLKVEELAQYKGKKLRGSIVHIRNTSSQEKKLHEKDFALTDKTACVALEKRVLQVQESARVFVVTYD